MAFATQVANVDDAAQEDTTELSVPTPELLKNEITDDRSEVVTLGSIYDFVIVDGEKAGSADSPQLVWPES